MQVHRKTHASAIPTPCKCIQTVIQAKPSSFKSSKMTISQKIKSDSIPFFSDLIPFFPEKSTQRKEKEKKKSKGNLSHSVQKEKYVWELFPPEKTEQKKRLKTVAFRPLFHYLCKLRIDKFNYKDERYQNKRTGRKQKELELH